jgi:hypothetical protein
MTENHSQEETTLTATKTVDIIAERSERAPTESDLRCWKMAADFILAKYDLRPKR